MQYCQNCEKNLPSQKYNIHLGYCIRNMVKCIECKRIYDKQMVNEHYEQFHRIKQCNYCKGIFSQQQLNNHLSLCQSKPILCQYCSLNIPKSIYQQHIQHCQSKSKICPKCYQYIQLKYYEQHQNECDVSLTQTIFNRSSISKQSGSNYSYTAPRSNNHRSILSRGQDRSLRLSSNNTNTNFSNIYSQPTSNESNYQINSDARSQYFNQPDDSFNSSYDSELQRVLLASLNENNYYNPETQKKTNKK